MDKLIFKRAEVRDKIISGLDFISNPVISTLSPRGMNVLIETEDGSHILTNDGVTIAKNISSKDQIEQSIIDIVKEASLRTNVEAGDGTTTTILLSQVLIKEALKLIDDGHSWIDIRDQLNTFADKLISVIDKEKTIVKDDKGLLEVATTSANNDKEIAKYVLEAVKVAREDGMIFIDGNNKKETEVNKDLGFMIKSGVLYQEMFVDNKGIVVFKNAPVLITDKKLYYAEEAETVLRVAVKAGHKNVVVVAKDIMGEALNVFITNHSKGVIQVMLVKDVDVTDKDTTSLHDLAIYLGGKVISDKVGSLVNKLTIEDFVMVERAFSDTKKTLFTPKGTPSKELKERIKTLQEELEKNKEDKTLKSRIASLTTGIVTIKVGANTPIELREKIYRYEDAINATRAAMKHGYLSGGGTSILGAYSALQTKNPSDYSPMFKKYSEAIVRQIAKNCGKHEDTVLEKVLEGKGCFGYNAVTDKYEDLLKAGIVDPFKVIEMAIRNSVAVTNIVISIDHYVINIIENDKDKTGT